MNEPIPSLPPPVLLAITHAPAPIRGKLQWLLQFDHRLGQVLERANEPLFAQMRLAWWRDALGKTEADRPRGEPLLALLKDMDDDPELIKAAQNLIDSFELQIVDDAADSAADRALAISRAYAMWAGIDPKLAQNLALAWAGKGSAVLTSFPRPFRPLTILAMAEQLDNGVFPAGPFGAGLRLSWHALTGR